jgi:hypothetical protein
MSETGFQVEERDGEIIVMCADLLFIETYYKRANESQLVLRRRTATNDHATARSSFSGSSRQGARARVDCVSGILS